MDEKNAAARAYRAEGKDPADTHRLGILARQADNRVIAFKRKLGILSR